MGVNFTAVKFRCKNTFFSDVAILFQNNKVLKKAVVWQNLYFYRKSDAIYQLTVEFCYRFMPRYGDRTIDQMVQATRSGEQNIIEGSEGGMTSSEIERISFLNIFIGYLRLPVKMPFPKRELSDTTLQTSLYERTSA